MTHVTPGRFAVLGLTLVVVFSGVLALYVALAVRARGLVRDLRAVRRINRASGVAMAGAAAAVASR